MKLFYFILFLFSFSQARTQVSFRTVAPQEPIISGESFQVQYILEDGKKAGVTSTPVFKGFRIVSGPNVYSGTVSGLKGSRNLYNIVYTLEAIKPGVFIIPGVSVLVNNQVLRSNDMQVEVISSEDALKLYSREHEIMNPDYMLRPGEDPYQKIRENLFVKVTVDKRNCWVGEPVLATFKLYSRLESRSDIVKNPGLYGFTVFDMVNLADKEVVREKLYGKNFDVHTIRKVQLYPLQAGNFTIDAMEVKNRVEFSRSAVNKKTEQEIVEGLQGHDGGFHAEGTDVYESYSSTEPVMIHVNALPEKNKPSTFTGAMGKFTIEAALSKNEFAKNEEGVLKVSIGGTGNFIQLDAPTIEWPPGIEGMEARVKDDFNKLQLPLSGSRSFLYPFVALTPGSVRVPPVSFSFFDKDSNRYKTIQTKELEIKVSNIPVLTGRPIETDVASGRRSNSVIIFSIIILIALVLFFAWQKRKGPGTVQNETAKSEPEDPFTPLLAAGSGDKDFYAALLTGLWKNFSEKFKLEGSQVNKAVLESCMRDQQIPLSIIEEAVRLIEKCEAGMFTTASFEENREELVTKAREIVSAVNQY